jgi:acetamidase/formamidase
MRALPRPGRPLRASNGRDDVACRAVDFTVARTGLSREEAYMLLSIIGELRVGTSPCPVIATRLIVPEEPLRAAGWNGDLP